jgi:glycosyltransferase involved in cell wall biosynthesis
MKILHVVQAYYPAIGGSEWLIKNLSEYLVSGYRDDVTVFTTNAYKPEAFWRTKGPFMAPGMEVINGVRVRRFKVFNGLQVLRKLLAQGSHRLQIPYNDWFRTIQTGPIVFGMTEAIAKSEADVVLATAFPFLHMYYALVGARRAGLPIALLGSIHAADGWGYERRMMYRAIQDADAYIALTDFERKHLIQRDIQPNKIDVIGAGVDADRFAEADGGVIRNEYGWGDKPVIGFIARQSELKRFDVLLNAMPMIWEMMPDVHLMLAGARTSYSPQIKQMIDSFPKDQQAQITVIHDFAENQKPQLLAACDVLAHPSANESFGIAFIEAWACGKPVVGANVGAISSVIDEGQDGKLYEFPNPSSMAETVLEILSDPVQGAQMGEAGRRKVEEKYTWTEVTHKLRELYTELAS